MNIQTWRFEALHYMHIYFKGEWHFYHSRRKPIYEAELNKILTDVKKRGFV